MASDKKRRKAGRQARKARLGPGSGIHPDGDRRRRAGRTADQALADKRAMQQFPGEVLFEDKEKQGGA